ncbi:MAG: hypothetical protein H6Q41_841 [Deltaproteobacteria bacterium]|nr:hypothetical protein [Deltaproteobacteria bacterium]
MKEIYSRAPTILPIQFLPPLCYHNCEEFIGGGGFVELAESTHSDMGLCV